MRKLHNFLLAAFTAALVVGCSCQPDPKPLLDDATDSGVDARSVLCDDNRYKCGDVCCNSEQACSSGAICCSLDNLCGDDCCEAGEVCEGAVCHRDCGNEARCRNEAGAEICCAQDEICISGACFEPTVSCEDFVDCDTNEYCEPSIGFCLPQPGGDACELVPTGGEVVPTVVWEWDSPAVQPNYDQVMMTPVVANLTDDNGDSKIDEKDVPDVIFISFDGDNVACSGYECDGIIRAVNGDDGTPIFSITNASLRVMPGGQLAVGDIDDDGNVEIVACGSDADRWGPLVAFNHDGSLLWKSTAPEVECGQAAPAIADLNADGNPEVFVRYTVLNGANGNLKWHQSCKNLGAFPSAGNDGGHRACDYTTAADLDGDGKLEVVGGNQAFNHNGTVYYNRSGDFRDGYPAVADIDGDGLPEVVIVQSSWDSVHKGDHHIRAINHDGTNLWGPFDINQGSIPTQDTNDGTLAGGGPPTIANFDNDARPEIALAGAFGYAVFEHDGTLKWFATTRDDTSRKTGSSVFDFDGDGVAEAVYNDEHWLRVYNGPDGTVRYCQCNTSATLWEYPVIADVNNDGAAEIIVASNNYAAVIGDCEMADALDACTMNLVKDGPIASNHGVRVFSSPDKDWVGTRRVWNQHTYHITNIKENGTLTQSERPNWSSPFLNNFRQNLQPDATNLTDGEPLNLSVDLSDCPDFMNVNVEVFNGGWSALVKDTPVTLYVEEDDTFKRVTTLFTPRVVLPGDSVILSHPYETQFERHTFKVVINDPGDMPSDLLVECREENNAATVDANCMIIP